jgi:hypothetical protein
MTLSIECSQNERTLCVAYLVQNPFDEAIYLRNWMRDSFGRPGGVPFSTTLAWTVASGEGRARFFCGRPHPLPGVRPIDLGVPLATRIEPGGLFRATITASLPLLEWTSHEPPRSTDTRAMLVREIDLGLEYLLESSCRGRDEHPNIKGAFRAWGTPEARFEARTRLAKPVTLLRREPPFERTL